MSFNKIIIQGRLTATPELRTTQSGTSVCSCSVAVNRRFDKEKTDFINCTAFGKTADFLSKFFQKGQEILMCGELHIDKYEKDGSTRTSANVIVDEVSFCGNKTDNSTQKESKTSTADFEEIAEDDEDLPF